MNMRHSLLHPKIDVRKIIPQLNQLGLRQSTNERDTVSGSQRLNVRTIPSYGQGGNYTSVEPTGPQAIDD